MEIQRSHSLPPYCGETLSKRQHATLNNLPTEVLEIIRFYIQRPMDHLHFSTSCTPIYRLYTRAYFHQRCTSFGFGRQLSRKKRDSWRRTFKKVVTHAMRCHVVKCVRLGVPPPADCERLVVVEEEEDADEGVDEEPTAADPCEGCPGREGGEESDTEGIEPCADVPKLHHHISSMGNVRLKHFVEGYFLLTEQAYNYECRVAGGGRPCPAVDREALMSLEDHRLLASAFACNPPFQLLYVKSDCLRRFKVENEDGVTVGDVISKMKTHFEQEFRKGDLIAYKEYEEEQYGGPIGTEACTYHDWETRWDAIEEMEQIQLEGDETVGLKYENFDILVKDGEEYPTIWFRHEYQDRYG